MSSDVLWTIAVAMVVLAVSFFNGSQSVAAIAGFAIASWWAAGLALVRSRRSFRLDPVARVALGALAAFAALGGASLLWASDQGLVLIELCRTLGYLGLLTAVVFGVGRRRGQSVLLGIALGLLAVAALALTARLFPGILEGDQIRLMRFSEAGGRLGYPVAYWNGLGFQMAALGLTLLWIGSAAGARSAHRSLAVAAIPTALLTLYLTGSRGGLLAFTVGVTALVALTPVRSRLLGGLLLGGGAALIPIVLVSGETAVLEGAGDQAAREAGLFVAVALVAAMIGAGVLRRRLDHRLSMPWAPAALRGPRPLVTLLLVGVAVFLVVGGPDRLAQIDETDVTQQEGRGELTGRFLQVGSRERVRLWETAVDAVASEPVHGIGAGAFTYFATQNGKVGRPVRDAHSLYFESLAELGPLGLAAILALFGAAVVATARRTYGDHSGEVAICGAILAAGMVGVALDWLWEIPAVMGLLVTVIGLLVGRATSSRDPSAAGGEAARGIGRAGLVGAALVGTLSVLLAGSFVVGERALAESRERTADDDYAAAASAAADAARLMPLDSRPWVQLGSVQRLAGDREAAIASLIEAVELAPRDPRPNALLGLVYLETEDPRYLDQAERITELTPQPVE